MLGKLLVENQHTKLPEVFALMALMCFHAARSESRINEEGEIILLPYQDRSIWDKGLIGLGNWYLGDAASGEEISPYHLEAAIAFEHCRAENFESTNWGRILELYEWLCRVSPSPVSDLNMAVAVMQVHGPASALELIQKIPDRKKMENYYLFHSLLGEIHSRMKNDFDAKRSFEKAMELARSEFEKKLLREKISGLRV